MTYPYIIDFLKQIFKFSHANNILFASNTIGSQWYQKVFILYILIYSLLIYLISTAFITISKLKVKTWIIWHAKYHWWVKQKINWEYNFDYNLFVLNNVTWFLIIAFRFRKREELWPSLTGGTPNKVKTFIF